MKTKREIVSGQIEIQREMQNAGFNLVTCGNCGTILLHRTGDEEIDCLCGEVMELCDCPDYWYEGAELSGEFKDVIYRVQNYRWEDSADPIIEDLVEFKDETLAFEHAQNYTPQVIGFSTQLEKITYDADGDVEDVEMLWESEVYQGENIEGALVVCWSYEPYVGYARKFRQIGIAGEYPFHKLINEADLITGNDESTFRPNFSIVMSAEDLRISSREEVIEAIYSKYWKWDYRSGIMDEEVEELLNKIKPNENEEI